MVATQVRPRPLNQATKDIKERAGDEMFVATALVVLLGTLDKPGASGKKPAWVFDD